MENLHQVFSMIGLIAFTLHISAIFALGFILFRWGWRFEHDCSFVGTMKKISSDWLERKFWLMGLFGATHAGFIFILLPRYLVYTGFDHSSDIMAGIVHVMAGFTLIICHLHTIIGFMKRDKYGEWDEPEHNRVSV